MKTSARLYVITIALLMFLATGSSGRAADTAFTKPVPGPGKWELAFKTDTSQISYFLKGNVHDTLGYVHKMNGTATAAIAENGSMTAAAVQFSFAADGMASNDEKRDERMKKKFMEIHLYPEVSFRGAAANLSTGTLALATKDKPVAFNLEGTLTIHGTAKQITIPLTVYPQSDLLIAEGSTVLLLQDFNIKNPSLLFLRTENNVHVEFHIELQPAG